MKIRLCLLHWPEIHVEKWMWQNNCLTSTFLNGNIPYGCLQSFRSAFQNQRFAVLFDSHRDFRLETHTTNLVRIKCEYSICIEHVHSLQSNLFRCTFLFLSRFRFHCITRWNFVCIAVDGISLVIISLQWLYFNSSFIHSIHYKYIYILRMYFRYDIWNNPLHFDTLSFITNLNSQIKLCISMIW